MQKCKVGPHFQFDGFDAVKWLQDATPSVAKFCTPKDDKFDGGTRMPEIGSLSPYTIAIGHPMLPVGGVIILGVGLGEEWRAGYTPAQVARAYCDKYMLPLARAYPRIDFWEPFNEFELHDDIPGAPTREQNAATQYKWFCECCYEAAHIMWSEVGKRCALGAWATGRPQPADFPNWHLWMEPILRACREYGAIYSRHGYDQSMAPDGSGGLPTLGGSLRYRDDLARFARMGYSDIKCVITECGWGSWQYRDPNEIAAYATYVCTWLNSHHDQYNIERWFWWGVYAGPQGMGSGGLFSGSPYSTTNATVVGVAYLSARDALQYNTFLPVFHNDTQGITIPTAYP